MNKEVLDFIRDEIDSVPHLEALLQLWSKRPRTWTVQEVAHAIFVEPQVAGTILHDLARQGLVTNSGEHFAYTPGNPEKDKLIEATERTYRADLVRITRMIHSKAAAPVREYARAFRFRKEGS